MGGRLMGLFEELMKRARCCDGKVSLIKKIRSRVSTLTVAELGSAGNDGDLRVKQRGLNKIIGRLLLTLSTANRERTCTDNHFRSRDDIIAVEVKVFGVSTPFYVQMLVLQRECWYTYPASSQLCTCAP